jgi:hypothetical protein
MSPPNRMPTDFWARLCWNLAFRRLSRFAKLGSKATTCRNRRGVSRKEEDDYKASFENPCWWMARPSRPQGRKTAAEVQPE